MKSRIEVDEMGRYVLIIPEDLIEDHQIAEGDQVWLIERDEGFEVELL